MSKYDSDYLIEQVKRRGSFPSSQNLFTDSRLILMLDDELKTRIVPFLMSFRDSFLLTYIDYSGDGSTTKFKIPTDAIGGKLNDVTIYSLDNTPIYFPVPRIEKLNIYASGYGIYIEDNYINFYPSSRCPKSNELVRVSYFKRVSDLVSTSSGREINAINGSDIDSSTTLPTTFVSNEEVQIISKENPFKIIWYGTISSILNNTITLSSSPADASIGDWICLKDESVFASIPIECIPLLCQATVVKCMSSINDEQGLKSALLDYAQMEQSIKSALSPKIDNSPKKVYNMNRLSNYL